MCMTRIRPLFSFILHNTVAVTIFWDCGRNGGGSGKMTLERIKLDYFPGHLTGPYISPK